MVLFTQKAPPSLSSIEDKVKENARLSLEDGLTLFQDPNLDYINDLASFARQRAVGNKVFYAKTLHLYPSNICSLQCPLCSFFCQESDKKAFFHPVETLISTLKTYLPLGITQVHIIGGLYHKLDLNYYKSLILKIHEIAPSLEIKALSAVEYDYIAKQAKIDPQMVLKELQKIGLSFLPGGGAEIFDSFIRAKIAPNKIPAASYLHIHKLAHELSIPSNCTMLYNHFEGLFEILSHIDRLRRLQDETGGFTSFVPLRYLSNNTLLGPTSPPYKEIIDQRLYQVSRLMLDNIPHICAPWNFEGLSKSLDLLSKGASSIGNVLFGEMVAKKAGGPTDGIDEERFKASIQNVGREPVIYPNSSIR
jgi:aminodeoxyfutalosine synthase